jgi:surfeit locus 1 family protein
LAILHLTRTGRGVALIGLAALSCAAFVALGSWQLSRRASKHELIERVAQRVRAAPVPLPESAQWPALGAREIEYLHVRVPGRYLAGNATRVHAATALGAGYWLLVPLRTTEGKVILVNRGFVPPDWKEEADRRAIPNEVVVTGLVRMSEPGGAFLHANEPAQERWYSRDVAAIARARSLADVAPFFIDADAGPQASDASGANPPVGGLTVVAFADNHLVYALTWFALAAMSARACRVAIRFPRHSPSPRWEEDRGEAG